MSERIPCPVCKGSKQSPFSANAIEKCCKCCNGLGSITQRKADTLKKLSADIARRLKRNLTP